MPEMRKCAEAKSIREKRRCRTIKKMHGNYRCPHEESFKGDAYKNF